MANLFPNGIVAVAELVKHESVQLGDIYLALFIQHGLVCQYANDLTDDMMTVDLHLVLGNSCTIGASTFSLFTAVRPLRSNLFAILLPLAMPKKSAASIWGISAILRVNAPRFLMFSEVL